MPDTLAPGMAAPSAPAARPPQAGLQARGILKLLAIRKAASMSLPELEPGSEPYKMCLDVLKALSKLPSASEGLTEQEAGAMKGAVTPVPQPAPGGGGAPPPQMGGGMGAGPQPAMMGGVG